MQPPMHARSARKHPAVCGDGAALQLQTKHTYNMWCLNRPLPLEEFSLEREQRKLTMISGCFGRPTMEGNTAQGASSPAKPALVVPDPLSITNARTSSSAAMFVE